MELNVDTKIIVGILSVVVGCYITVRTMMAELKTKIENLEKEVDNHGAWKEKLVDTLRDFSVVMGKLEVKLEDLDKDVSRIREEENRGRS